MRNRVWLAAFLLPLSAAGSPALAGHDSLVVGVAQFPASLHPYISSQTVQFYTIGFATRPISAFDTSGAPVCLLCTDLPTLENGLARIEDKPDGSKGLSVTIKLKPDLRWGDGAPVTANDVAFTWRLGSDPASGFSNLYTWSRATSVDVVDEHTAVLHLDRTLVTYQVWDYLLPEHIEGAVLKQYPAMPDYINHTTYATAPTTPGLWNGPYIITGYQSGSTVTLEPNPQWQGRKPAIKRVVMRTIENTAALAANLLSGDVDMTPFGIGISTDQADAMQKDHPNSFRYIYKPGLSLERLTPKLENPMLADVRVRQALLVAIDRRALIDKIFDGHAKPALSWTNELEPRFDGSVTSYPFDPARARALLKDAGYTPGPDGICTNAKGERLSFDFSTTSGNRIRELSQQVFQNQWKAVCIEVSIHNMPARQFFGELTRMRKFTGLVEFANSSRFGLPPRVFLHSTAIGTEANGWAGFNVEGYVNPHMNELIEQAEIELDPARQKVLWSEMQHIFANDLPELPLYFREDPDVVPVWLKGYEANGREDYVSYWAENWSD